MRNVKLSMFTDSDMQRVHDCSLRLLEENGMNFANDRVLDIFKKHGFRVDGTQVYFTEDQVSAALKTTPHSFVFLVTDDTLDYMYDVWYPAVSDWNREPEKDVNQDYEYVLRRANVEWKRRINEAPETMLDADTEKALNSYVEKHTI